MFVWPFFFFCFVFLEVVRPTPVRESGKMSVKVKGMSRWRREEKKKKGHALTVRKANCRLSRRKDAC